MTPKEIDALPIGPIKQIIRPLTLDEKRAGAKGHSVCELVAMPVKLTAYKKDDPIAYVDSAGRFWRVEEWADGDKYKTPFSL